MADVKRCPVCNGRGIVPSNFYSTHYEPNYSHLTCSMSTSNGSVTCRSCHGKGIIIIPDVPLSGEYILTCKTADYLTNIDNSQFDTESVSCINQSSIKNKG